MKRRRFAWALVLTPLAFSTGTLSAAAQGSPATQLQIELSLAFVGLSALRTRYGDAHADVVAARARIGSLATSLRAAVARREVVDVLAVTRALDAELADVRVRLAEFSQRCGSGHPDMQSAHVRASALEAAIAHVTSDGIFFPPVDGVIP